MNLTKNAKYLPIIVFSLMLGALTFLYLVPQLGLNGLFDLGLAPRVLYFLIFILSVGAYLHIFLFSGKISFSSVLERTLVLYAPTEILVLYGLQMLKWLNPYFGLLSAFYILLLFIWIIRATSPEQSGQLKEQVGNFFQKIEATLAKADWKVATLVLLLMALNLSFGLYHLGKMAIVDEPLWTFDRIPNFWKNVGEMDWYNSYVSDKPGLPVAVISGIGLLSEENPKQFKKISWEGEVFNPRASQMDKFNVSFRFPLLAFAVLLLPLFYFLVKKLAGRPAGIFSVIFISLSPILIGNSRIINPDGLLWIFTSFSFLCYLIHLKNTDNLSRFYLYLSSIFLALAILTKYTANILYLFFFALIFAEYILNHKKYADISIRKYLKKALLDYVILIVLSLAAFYFLYPAVWEKPSRVLIGTIYSQALEPIWPYFAGILAFVLADFLILKSLVITLVLRNFVRIRKFIFISVIVLFLLSAFGVFLNVYSSMKFFDFESILASPKSAYSHEGPLGMFFANFYPLLFGISPLALAALFIFIINNSIKRRIEDDNLRTIIYILFFILVYYAGAVVSHVASIIRYQIVLFPLVFIASGIALSEILKTFFERRGAAWHKYDPLYKLFPLILVILLVYPLFKVKPFYMGYASRLLPGQFYLDVKDMGDGSFEAARYLNMLPDAASLKVWSDKQGVCVFFVGHCYTSLSSSFFSKNEIDYFVVSSGRESRTVRMSADFSSKVDFSKIYDSSAGHLISIAGRVNNFVKIISSADVSK